MTTFTATPAGALPLVLGALAALEAVAITRKENAR
jgi:hypothetical protein